MFLVGDVAVSVKLSAVAVWIPLEYHVILHYLGVP